jgi:hypothetical protein
MCCSTARRLYFNAPSISERGTPASRLGGVLDRLPFGLTTPEMAALMGALGCGDAELLDGGVSGQLLVRDAAGEAHEWAGMRRVPVGLVVVDR